MSSETHVLVVGGERGGKTEGGCHRTFVAEMDGRTERQAVVGIVGLGDMGKLYARSIAAAGWSICACDLPERFDELRAELDGDNINVVRDGFAVVRRSDFVVFSVETEKIAAVVALYGPAMKVGSIACGQTSVKAPEIAAFEKYLPEDVHIVTCHSMHGPSVNPRGQPLIIMHHRSDQEHLDLAVNILSSLESNIVHLNYIEHDLITADTQAATHIAFLSMGTTWKVQSTFPWENPSYIGGIENAKIAMALRIYGSKWHVYAGLAIMNPNALVQAKQYAKSVSALFKLMIQENKEEFTKRIHQAREFVFGKFDRDPILLCDSLLNDFSLSAIPESQRMPNSHLSLLAVVDCWYQLKINPYSHLICQTPPFRLLLGITEYLFRNEKMLEESIHTALYDKQIRPDDCEFYTAANGWTECISLGSSEAYRKRFEETAQFFELRTLDARQMSSKIIELIAERTQDNKESD